MCSLALGTSVPIPTLPVSALTTNAFVVRVPACFLSIPNQCFPPASSKYPKAIP